MGAIAETKKPPGCSQEALEARDTGMPPEEESELAEETGLDMAEVSRELAEIRAELGEVKAASTRGIGAMNGVWQMGLKVLIVAQGLLLPWCIWVTTICFQIQFDHVSHAEIRDMERRMENKIAALPPPDWRDKIHGLEAEVKSMHNSIIRLEALLDHGDRP